MAVTRLLLLGVLLFACRRQDGIPAEQRWLREHAIPVTTTDARSGLADLAPLRNVVGDARIVALGEATHGSREIFTMKHRLVEYLVEKMGFTVFAIEANLPEADRINNYVLHGAGDPAKALDGIYFWTWNTEEVLDLIRWMREYNVRRGSRRPVKFRGFDNQYAKYAVEQVVAYLMRVDPRGARTITRHYDCFPPHTRKAFNELSPPSRVSCRLRADEAVAAMRRRRSEYAARSSAEEFERHLRYARVIAQTLAVWIERGGPRDKFMAENVEWLADVAHPGEKIILWAHNFHVAAHQKMMGRVLRDRFGGELLIVGFAFDRGSFTAVRPGNLGAHTIGEGRSDGFEAFLRTAGHPRVIVDLRTAPPDVAAWLRKPQPMWNVGAVYTGVELAYRPKVPVARAYDVVVFIETTTPTRLLKRDH